MSARRLIVPGLALLAALTTSCAKSPVGPNDNGWRLLPGHVESFAFQGFRDGRQCWVYLPPNYSTGTARYPVLYLNDGELGFDRNSGMHVNRICEDLIRRGEIEPIIVVAIETAGRRFTEYTPWFYLYWPATGGGDAYVRAVRDSLKPEVDRRYRTLPDRGNTAMAGGSLGGLISIYAAFAYDTTFGKAAGFSPTYYNAEIYNLLVNAPRPRNWLRFYQDSGYPDDNYIGHMEEIAVSRHLINGVDFMSITAPGGEHAFAAWQHRFPNMLKFLFPPKAPPP